MNYLKNIFLVLVILCASSCEELLLEQNITNESVILLAPADGAEVSATTIQFNWEKINGATHYEIQVATPNFETAEQVVVNTSTDSIYYQTQLIEDDYEWRVKAKNDEYNTPYTFASFKVVPVVEFSNNTVILLSPQNGFVTNNEAQILQWEPIQDATIYRIQIVDNTGSPVLGYNTSATEQEVSFPEGNYTWKVRAEKDSQNTLYSERDILVDVTNPATPQLISPEDEEVLVIPQVSFNWERESNQGSVEFDSIYVYRDINQTDLVVKDQANSPFEMTLSNDTYYWFIKSFDKAGNVGNNSNVYTFTIN